MDDFDPDIFWDQVRGAGDCWVWTGKRVLGGYGVVSGYQFTEKFAHRLAWTMANGPIPGGMWVLHHCDNPPCVNPDHLYIGTPRDNALDRERRGRSRSRDNLPLHNKPRMVCRRGHPIAGDNELRFADGSRRCLICYRIAADRRNQYARERRAAAQPSVV